MCVLSSFLTWERTHVNKNWDIPTANPLCLLIAQILFISKQSPLFIQKSLISKWKKKKKREILTKKRKKNQVSILQWVWNTQFCLFSLLLNTAFICTALLLPRLVSDWKIKSLPFLTADSANTPVQHWVLSLEWGGMPWTLLREQPPRGHLTWVCPCTGIQGVPRMECPQLPTVLLVKPQTRLWRVWLWKSTMLEGVIKSISFQCCALVFLSAVQAFLWKLKTKRPLMYGATWKQRQQRTWDREGNCFPHVPNMEHWQGQQGVSCCDISFVVPSLCQLCTVGCELRANMHPRIMGFSESPSFSHCAASAQQKDHLDKSPDCWRWYPSLSTDTAKITVALKPDRKIPLVY